MCRCSGNVNQPGCVLEFLLQTAIIWESTRPGTRPTFGCSITIESCAQTFSKAEPEGPTVLHPEIARYEMGTLADRRADCCGTGLDGDAAVDVRCSWRILHFLDKRGIFLECA